MARRSTQRTAPAALRRARGFTLMEMMIVVVVVGILAGVALPAYQESLRKGRRTDAKEALMEVANREEQYMLDNSTYVQDMKLLGYAKDPMESDDKHYTIDRVVDASCGLTTTTCYVLKATPVATSPQADDERCKTFTLYWTGEQKATGTDAAHCW